MIFLPKGLQGERGLRGLTGEKGEPVRGGWQGKETDQEPWGNRSWAPRDEWKMGGGLLLKLPAPDPSDWEVFTPPTQGSKEADLLVP